MIRGVFIVALVVLASCGASKDAAVSDKRHGLSVKETTEGILEALLVGADRSTTQASQKDGFFKNAAIRILFPEEVVAVRDAALKVGMRPLVDRFEMSLNRAAEDASKEAKPVIVDAIRKIKFKDVWEILFGGETAATDFLRMKTEVELTAKFRHIVAQSIAREEVTKHWKPLAEAYNRIPLVKKVDPDLEAYVTAKTVEGLFKLMADEERKIRENPFAYASNILRKVFGKKKR
jgi:hypothetical protein